MNFGLVVKKDDKRVLIVVPEVLSIKGNNILCKNGDEYNGIDLNIADIFVLEDKSESDVPQVGSSLPYGTVNSADKYKVPELDPSIISLVSRASNLELGLADALQVVFEMDMQNKLALAELASLITEGKEVVNGD